MSEQQKAAQWFALHIRIYNQENVITSLLHKGYEVFAPTYVATRIVVRREREIRAPLFPGYIFCTLDPQYRLPVVSIPGVIGILGTGNVSTPIPDGEIESIRRMVASGLPIEPYQLLQPGEPVQVQKGVLAGLEGVVVHHKGKHRLVISVSALNDRAVSVEVDQSMIVPLNKRSVQSGKTIASSSLLYYQKTAC